MKDERKTKQELLQELVSLRQRIAEMEQSESERKQMEEALRKSEETLKLITDNMSDMVRVLDLQGNNVYASPSHYSVLGYKPEDRVGKSTFDIVHPDDVEGLIRVFSESLARRQPTMVEYRVRHANGHYVWLETVGDPIRDDKGDITAVVVSARDISERKASEERLRKSEERYRALAYSIDSMYLVDRECRYLFINEGYRQRIGIPLEEIIGRRYNEFHPKEDAREFTEKVKEVYESGKPIQHEYISEREQKYFIRTFSPVMDQEGKSISAVTVAAKDITDRKHLEAHLLQAQKMEALGTLSGGIAHDFNNILTGILGNIGLAMIHMQSEDITFKRLAAAEKAALQARDLTQHLLTFSRGGAPVKKAASITELLRDSVMFALTGSNVQCKFSIPADLRPLDVDEGQMNQVINNLIVNALQAMPEGGTIKVGAENIIVGAGQDLPLKEGKYVKISIEDEGIGISKAHLQKIFDPYFTTKQKGSGLGLAITYSIVRQHGGYIDVESDLGVGTKFSIYLPASSANMAAKERPGKEIIGGEGKVLLMDDEEVVRDVAGEMLKHMGYTVEFAKDGIGAIDLYIKARSSGRPFDVVIMDLTIPGGMGGKEAIKRLREIDPSVKAVVSSGYSNDPIMADFRSYGFSGIVAKPYKIEELGRVLDTVRKGHAPG